MKLVTVYIPTKNRLSLLKRSVYSVLAQTHKNIELIIVDDGSSDGTLEYLHQLANENSNVRFFANEKSEGACVARNRAIVAAQGEFVAGLDDDDEFTEDRIEKMLEAYDDKYSFVTSSLWWDHGKRRTLLGGEQVEISFSDQLLRNHATNQVLVKKQRIVDAGLFDVDFPACQDWEMWTRLTKIYGTALKIASPTYVVHAGHEELRITLSPNRIKGFELFFQKYSRYMTDKDLVAFKLKLIEAKKEKLSFSTGIRCITSENYQEVVKLWLISYLPILQRIKKRFMSGK
jgi:glycosyltransferase involved in cell wall biosynthesis